MVDFLDSYLSEHGLTRYELAKQSGISQTTWADVSRRDLDRYTVRQLRSIGNVIGKGPDAVLHDLYQKHLFTSLHGLRPYLDKYDLHDQKLERQVYDVLDQLAENGVSVAPFTFNRFDDEVASGKVADPKEALRRAVKEAVKLLRDSLKKKKHGDAPVPE